MFCSYITVKNQNAAAAPRTLFRRLIFSDAKVIKKFKRFMMLIHKVSKINEYQAGNTFFTGFAMANQTVIARLGITFRAEIRPAADDDAHTNNDGKHTNNDGTHINNDGTHINNDGTHIYNKASRCGGMGRPDILPEWTSKIAFANV
jgi:hypothetical protein